MWALCHRGMTHPQAADGGDLYIWSIAANMLNQKSRTAGKKCLRASGVEQRYLILGNHLLYPERCCS
jgi:hypothetical protein